MSAIEWIGASQVSRSRTGSRIGRVSSVDVGVLDPGLGERLDQLRVELGVGLDVDHGALVEALQVERVDGAGLDQLGDQLVAPVVGRVELEAQAGVAVELAPQRLDRGGLAHPARREPHRGDELDRPRLAAERRGKALARLAQRQVERRRLEGPAAVEAGDVALRARPGRCPPPPCSSENSPSVA